MAKIVYTLKKKKDTEELHLFEAVPTAINRCRPKPLSVCKKMKKEESEANIFTCKSENDARLECAQNGRKVCGPCVSHLYETY